MAYKLVEGMQGAKGFAAEGGWSSVQEMADEVGLDLHDIAGLYFECGELPVTWPCKMPMTSRLERTRVLLVMTCHRSYSIVTAKATKVIDKGLTVMTIIGDDEYAKIGI